MRCRRFSTGRYHSCGREDKECDDTSRSLVEPIEIRLGHTFANIDELATSPRSVWSQTMALLLVGLLNTRTRYSQRAGILLISTTGRNGPDAANQRSATDRSCAAGRRLARRIHLGCAGSPARRVAVCYRGDLRHLGW